MDCQPNKSGDLHGQATKLPGGYFMKVWVVIEEDRGCGVSVVGVYYNKDNVILHSHEYLYESEIHDAPGNAQQQLQPDTFGAG